VAQPSPRLESADLGRPAKPTFSQWLRTSPWWQKALVLLPLLVAVGGPLEAPLPPEAVSPTGPVLTGLLLATINQAVLRTRLSMLARVAICLFVIAVGIMAFMLAVAMVEAMHPLSGMMP